MNSLKFKIVFVLVVFTIITLTVSIIGNVFIRQLSTESGEIIKDNYQSIEYVNNMYNAIDNLTNMNLINETISSDSLKKYDDLFQNNLYQEANNITEPGEKELVLKLASEYQILKQSILNRDNGVRLLHKSDDIKVLLNDIFTLNMNAISLKNAKAGNTSNTVSHYMLFAGIASGIFSLLILLYFPNYILKPLYELTTKIKEIAKGNYKQKINIKSSDELGRLADSFNIMTDKLEDYEKNNINKLLFEKKRIESVIMNLNDAIIILNEGKIVININTCAEKVLGMKRELLLGKYAPDIATYNDLMREVIMEMFTDKASENKLIPIFLDGSEKYYQREIIKLSLSSEEENDGLFFGYIITLSNVTWFENRDSAKTNLIATVSHELKTPLSSINLSLKLLEYNKVGELNEEQKNILTAIRQQTGRLSKVVNELLDYTQVESGNIKLRKTETKPSDLVEYATYSLMMLIADKNIQLDIQIEDKLPALVVDVEKTVWVLINLITNAIRYTPEGGIIVIAVSKVDENIQFSVSDFGPGIPKEDFENIFNRFVQIGDSNLKGKGLGLAIAKDFVTAQNGDIWVESELGVGSTFTFKFPIK